MAAVRAAGDAEPRLVDLNVVAVDSRGQPVNDLTAGDFQVADAGKQRPVAFFRHNGDRLKQSPALGNNEFSNRGNTVAPHATLILFDLLNERFSTRGTSANQMVRELGNMETADGLFLYMLTVDGHLYPVHGLAGTEGDAGHSQAPPWTGQIKPLMDAAMRAVTRVRPVEIDVNVRVLMTLNALDEVAAQLVAFPGRKNIVWITDGIPIALGPQRSDTGDFVDFTPQLRLLSEQFDRSGAALYPVRQVMMGSPDAMGAGAGAGAVVGSGAGSEATLDELAGLTGGRPTGSKDIGPAVRQAMSDLRTSYQIGYYTPDESWDGKFHKLRVVCKRKGVRVQAKTGYYAWAEPPGAKAQRAIAAAVSGNDDAAEIGLRAVLSRDAGNPTQARIAVRIDAGDIALAHTADRYSGQLRLALAGYRKDGSVATSGIAPLDLDYSAADRDKALREGTAFNQDVALDDTLSKIRVVVFDRGSNAVGSVSIPVDGAGKDR